MKAGFRDAVSRARSSHRLVEAVAEALHPFGASSSAEELVRNAMGQSSPSFELDERPALRAFLGGALRRAIEDRLGHAIAEMVLTTVEQALGLPPDVEESGVIPCPPPSSGRERPTQPSPPRQTLLLVVSDTGLRDRVLQPLEDGSFALLLCTDPEEAAYLYRTARPAAVLIDDEPDGRGRFRRLEQLRHALLGQRPEVVLLTSRPSSISQRVAAVAPRGVDGESLLMTLRSVLGPATAVAPSEPAPPSQPAPHPAPQVLGGNHALVAEVLGTVATPERQATIVTRALELADRDAIPEDMLSFAAFAVGPLYQVVADMVGEDMASSLVGEITTIVQRSRASSGVLRRTRPGGSVPPPEERPRAQDGQPVQVLLVGARSGSFGLALERMGFVVAKAPNGHAALDSCASRCPHVLVVSSDSRGLSVQQLTSLLELSLEDRLPAVVALAATADLTIDGADQVVAEDASVRAIAAAIRDLLAPSDEAGSGR